MLQRCVSLKIWLIACYNIICPVKIFVERLACKYDKTTYIKVHIKEKAEYLFHQ